MNRTLIFAAVVILGCSELPMSGTGGGAGGGSTGGGGGGFGNTGGGFMMGAGAGPGSGTITASSGFRSKPHGFSFENYTNEGVTNLTSVELRRLFGDAVCATLENGACTLTPVATQWMEQANGAMNGGHCFGMSHTALLMQKGTLAASAFGGPDAFALQKGDERLQREIAYWMSTQFTAPGNRSITSTRPTPNELLTQLAEGWARNERFTLAFFMRQGGGGHAVTPHSLQTLPNGKVELVVYDNNYPNADRAITFDAAANSWSYSASVNPMAPASGYDGDATTRNIFAVPVADAEQPQQCTFCGNASPANAMAAPRTVSALGGGDLVVDDGQGHQVGTDGAEVGNTFPGAQVLAPLSAELYADDTEPRYVIPAGSDLTVTLSGARLAARAASSVSIVGPGYALSVEGLQLDPGQTDQLWVSADGQAVGYATQGPETPTVFNTFTTAGDDFEVGVQVVSDADGAQFLLERAGSVVALKLSGAGATQYGVLLTRAGANGSEHFLHAGTALQGDATLSFDLATWAGNGSPLTLSVDLGSDGSVDQTEVLVDQD
ncbi:MAG: hypothetical protein Q8K32_17210 [Archangium sp.]|nr:hypothetical protein [Archangium sp.]